MIGHLCSSIWTAWCPAQQELIALLESSCHSPAERQAMARLIRQLQAARYLAAHLVIGYYVQQLTNTNTNIKCWPSACQCDPHSCSPDCPFLVVNCAPLSMGLSKLCSITRCCLHSAVTLPRSSCTDQALTGLMQLQRCAVLAAACRHGVAMVALWCQACQIALACLLHAVTTPLAGMISLRSRDKPMLGLPVLDSR